MEFKIIRSHRSDKLEEDVNAHMKEGWVPHGSLQVICHPVGGKLTDLLQPMVRGKEKINQQIVSGKKPSIEIPDVGIPQEEERRAKDRFNVIFDELTADKNTHRDVIDLLMMARIYPTIQNTVTEIYLESRGYDPRETGRRGKEFIRELLEKHMRNNP